uniref:Mitochondrial carrier protein n=1 Tax=Chromera velia CCMP2878 TaxID=1169474 RepID=A0A0G4I511_9ALVE|eukprot:Cvel_1828.t1-p1 / transcript=Cvel_1828.t1 / gene=Cvel_1828 / organism=Chromera_velia_CCMP2878 / gene_product=Uncharacterized mitochondrial carrier YMR166C, putative / transcript_product=Uncharacterized mitochondrial carrier YMR166C, putative / location=Cvel_scaffold67:104241-107350(-) / protein_length=356 / sequence_SO=supercontig / SO=protein_coding / is_pseudo=false
MQGREVVELRSEISHLRKEVRELTRSVATLTELLVEFKAERKAKKAPAPRPKFYPFWVNFTAGSCALPLGFAVMHPLDTIRTQMQANVASTVTVTNGNGGGGGAGVGSNLVNAFRVAGARVLSRGFLTSVLGAAPQGGLRFGAYGVVQQCLDPYFDSQALQNACSAVAGDFASSLVKVPREVVTQRLQAGMYSNAREGVVSILRTEGIRGLFAGYWTTAARDVPFMVVLFVSYEQFKLWKLRVTTSLSRKALPHGDLDHPWTDAETVLWGGISGALAGWTTTPLDVVKTKVMTASRPEDRKVYRVVSAIVKESGFRGFFTSAIPRSCWWFSVCSIFFSVFERTRLFLLPDSQMVSR